MNSIYYKNIIFYKGNFYTEPDVITTTSTHNRYYLNNSWIFKPLNINNINLPQSPVKIFPDDYIMLLIDHFHWNMGHNLWDHMYPSWYSLYYYFNNNSKTNNFTWLCIKNYSDIHVHTHKNMINNFSGTNFFTLESLKKKYDIPIIIPTFITGLDKIGISYLNKDNLTVNIGKIINDLCPIKTFVNRFYLKYNIIRNSLYNDLDKCNNIIYIKNKRPYNGIEELFLKMNKKYNYKYNFKIVDYKKYDFKEQLEILNRTCICIVGIGNARSQTPFLPEGAIEIQTNNFKENAKNNIEFFDCHLGTLANYIKVYNIESYTNEEKYEKKCSYLLEQLIDDALNKIPIYTPIKVVDNLPNEVNKLTSHINYNKEYDIWRNKSSNIIEELINKL